MKHITFVLLFIIITLFFIYIATIFYGANKKLPKNTNYQGTVIPINDGDVAFLKDITYVQNNVSAHELEIQNHILTQIEQAKKQILLDCFLFNTYKNKGVESKPVVEAVVNKLINKKRRNPNISITIITDPINGGYGSYVPAIYSRLQNNGITVLTTNLNAYRDSTPLVSSLWRLVFHHLPVSKNGKLANLLADSAPKMTLRSYMELANIKANHRKVLVADDTVTIMSGNIHNASALFSNIALSVKNEQLAHDLLVSEESVVTKKKSAIKLVGGKTKYNRIKHSTSTVQVLTEKQIKDHILADIIHSNHKDTIWMGMFYIADRQIIHALIDAAKRGTTIKLILDPNVQAFGHKKIKLPNAPVAKELRKKTDNRIQIRWYHTRKEQYHTKFIYFNKQKQSILYNGSANLTTRNLDNYNLETDLRLVTLKNSRIDQQVANYFHILWENKNGHFTDSYEQQTTHFEPLLRGIYRWQTMLELTTY